MRMHACILRQCMHVTTLSAHPHSVISIMIIIIIIIMNYTPRYTNNISITYLEGYRQVFGEEIQ